MSEQSKIPLDELFAGWRDNVGCVLSEVSTSTVNPILSAEPQPGWPASEESDIWFSISCGPPLEGILALRFPLQSAVVLAAKFMGEAAPEGSPFDDARREALEELLRQIAGRAATSIAVLHQCKLEIQGGEKPGWAEAGQGWLHIPELSVYLEMKVSQELGAALARSASTSESGELPLPAAAPEAAGSSRDNLDVLMGTTLKVALRFGERHLLLREVLELGAGMVVELDRRVDEPVDLLLEGKVVARGEVVIVNGNYGLRVTEVVHPQAA